MDGTVVSSLRSSLLPKAALIGPPNDFLLCSFPLAYVPGPRCSFSYGLALFSYTVLMDVLSGKS